MNYDWNFHWVWNNLDLLFKGLFVSFKLTVFATFLGIVLSVLLLSLRTSKIKFLRFTAIVLIEIFRSIPFLVLLVWLYYCLPLFMSSIKMSAFSIAVLGLTLNFAGYQSEIFRSAYSSIPVPQIEVLKSMRFSKWQALRYVVIPQTFYKTLGPLLGQFINTLKLSALASIITVPELFYQTSALIQESFRPLEFYTALAFMYLLIIIPISISVQSLENYYRNKFEF